MRAVICCGLGWGDEGKGACVDKLTREFPVDLIVRYGGGSQCAHNVVTSEGVHHTFSQFGSGMLASQTVRTHLSRFMLVNPLSMMNEAESLNKKTSNVWWRTTVDKQCIIITPYHRLLNQMRERARGEARHGSCGVGVGVAREMHLKYGNEVLFAEDTKSLQDLRLKLEILRERYWEENRSHPEYDLSKESLPDINELIYQYMHWPARIVDGMEPSECMVFEGAQGLLLDEKYGQAPHNTWTNTTFENADMLLDEVGVTDRTRIGCLRTYHTRHGAGPFPTENNSLDLPELHNGTGEFQGAFRVGDFDFLKARQAIDIVGGIDYLALSHIDYLERMGLKEHFADDIAEILGVKLGMKANGPTAAHRTLSMEEVYA